MFIEKELVWVEASSSTSVLKIRILHDRQRVRQNVGQSLCICEEIQWRRFPHPLVVRGQHVDCRTGPYEDPSAEEGLEQVVLDERYGSGEANPGYAHCSR